MAQAQPQPIISRELQNHYHDTMAFLNHAMRYADDDFLRYRLDKYYQICMDTISLQIMFQQISSVDLSVDIANLNRFRDRLMFLKKHQLEYNEEEEEDRPAKKSKMLY